MIKSTTRKFKQPHLNLVLLLLIGVGMSILTSSPAQANASASTWTDPVNLSLSGSATAPLVITDSAGNHHVLWQDAFDGFMYTSGGGINWSEPTAATFPFSNPPFSAPASDNFNGLYTPRLFLDGQGNVHAFWRAEGTLVYSNAPVAELSSAAGWSTPQALAASASAYAVTVAADSRLHLAYIRTATSEEFPAGVYYQQRSEGEWSTVNRIFQSNYLRAATVDQLHVDIAAVGPDRIFVAWDSYLTDTVYYAQSTSGGSNWSDAVSIDQRGPGDALDTPGPHYVQLITHDGQIHLLWNRYSNVGRCELSHRWSANGGRQWQSRKVLLEGVNCPTHRHALVDKATNQLYLLSEQERNSIVVHAWHNDAWHSPQVIGTGLLNFTNPETLRSVSLSCLQPVVTQGQLSIIGCGQGNVKDIWLISVDLPDISQLAHEQQIRWQLPTPVNQVSGEQLSPVMLSGQAGLIHLLWLERDKMVFTESETVVRYAYGDSASWSRAAPVATGNIDQMVAAITDDDRLLLVWRDLDQKSLLFSQVEAAQAAFPTSWSPPKELVNNEPAVSHPSLLVTADNQIYLVYALTINEGRGIYVRYSEDGGFNWSEPMLAFDAAAAGWPRIDTPSLALTADGGLHLMWGHYALLAENQPTAYYYARSLDSGRTWSATPTLVAEGSLGFAQVTTVPASDHLLRLWQVKDSERSTLWYQQSVNAGRTWESPALLPSLGELSGITTTLVDPAGRLHLLHMTAASDVNARLHGWLWRESSWQAETETTFELLPTNSSHNLSALIQDDGTFSLVFTGVEILDNAESTESHLFYTMRPITLPEERPFAAPVLEEPTPAATPPLDDALGINPEEVTPEPTIDLVALADESLTRTQYGPIDTTTPTGRILAGVLPATLIVMFGIALKLYALRRRE